MAEVRPPPKPKRQWSLRSRALRGVLYQIVAIAVVGAAVWFLAHNTLENMRVRGIQSGFDFLTQPAGFDIGESLIPYESNEPYWKAFLVGVVNTLRVALAGIVMTTVLGTLLGIGRFSPNALVRGLCYAYVEFFRNIPILLQLLVWYLLLTEVLPDPGSPISVFGSVFLSKGGVSFPAPVWMPGHGWMALGALAGLVGARLYARAARRRFEATGLPRATLLPGIALVLLGAAVGWAAGGAPSEWRFPESGDAAVTGGGEISPEFIAVLLGLTLYTSAFVAEVVRAGIQSVPRGQVEAANALGLPRGRQMRLVVLPQALRVIIPPMTNQYLNLTKNSSLAVAIGYPDVVSISNTALNQTGRAVECIAIIMGVYLFTSLSTSAFMNWYNQRAAIKERVMADDTFKAIAARPAPANTEGVVPWVKANLFGSAGNAVTTVVLIATFLYVLPQAVSWGYVNAVFAKSFDACQAARGTGACWGVIAEKYRIIIFGRYPLDLQWRPEVATGALVALLVLSCVRACWKPWLVPLWLLVLAFFFALMGGGTFFGFDTGLTPVPTERWGGLPLTIMLATLAIVFAFPISVVVALGRRSRLPAIKTVCVIYVELIRGVPLISVLFMASFMFPLFMPPGTNIDVLLRVLVGITLFAAAYMAEIVRGGLQAIPKGQLEAADTLGLTYWQTQRKIVLPQALALVVPGLMNNFISLFKDTSLVTIVSLYELTGAMSLALNGDSDWRPFKIEAYLFIAAIYFVGCFAMSRYSLWIEKQLRRSTNR